MLPAFAVTYLVAAPGGLRRRVAVLLACGLAVLSASAWWVAIVDLVPRDARPYIGGSTDNTVADLVLGYDGLGRIFGDAAGGAGGAGLGGAGGPGGPGGPGSPGGLGRPSYLNVGPRGGVFGGSPGLLRMFNAEWAGQISWLLPPAAVGLAVGLAARLRAPRTDQRRAAFLLWGLWALVHVVVFSLMTGIVHPYYAVAIAPAAAALTGGGIVELWRARRRIRWAAFVAAGVIVVTAWWGWQVLEQTPAFWPGAGMGALLVAASAGIIVIGASVADTPRSTAIRRVALAAGVAAMLVGPMLYTVDTMGKAITGGDPAPGPENSRFGGFPGGFPRGAGGFPGDAAGTDDALVAWLVAHHGDETWLAAVGSANQAGPLQLASGVPVMAMGGFMGSDPAPTLEQLRAYVRDGTLRYVLLGEGRGGGPGGFFGGDGRGSVAGERWDWVTSSCAPVEGLGVTLFDCRGAAGSA